MIVVRRDFGSKPSGSYGPSRNNLIWLQSSTDKCQSIRHQKSWYLSVIGTYPYSNNTETTVRGFENVGTYLGLALIRMALIRARLYFVQIEALRSKFSYRTGKCFCESISCEFSRTRLIVVFFSEGLQGFHSLGYVTHIYCTNNCLTDNYRILPCRTGVTTNSVPLCSTFTWSFELLFPASRWQATGKLRFEWRRSRPDVSHANTRAYVRAKCQCNGVVSQWRRRIRNITKELSRLGRTL